MDQDPAVGQRQALAGRSSGQQQRAHRHRDPVADRLDVGADELHRVVDRQAGVDRAAGGVDVQVDVLVGVIRLEVDQLGDDQVGDVLVHLAAEEHDAVVQQPRVDVEGALAAAVFSTTIGTRAFVLQSCRKVQPLSCINVPDAQPFVAGRF